MMGWMQFRQRQAIFRLFIDSRQISNCWFLFKQSFLNKVCRINELSRGSVLGLKFSQTTSARNVPWLLAKSCVVLVCCVFYSKSLTMAAVGVGAIRLRHLPDSGIQWLRVKPWMCSIGRCAPCCTAASPWPSKLLLICLHFLSRQFRCWPQP